MSNPESSDWPWGIRLALYGGALAIILAVCGAWIQNRIQKGIHSRFQKIEVGMSRKEVERLMGRPPGILQMSDQQSLTKDRESIWYKELNEAGATKADIWIFPDGAIIVGYDKNESSVKKIIDLLKE
jgi:hypothetical protein